MKQFHHIGVPTQKKQANETYLAAAKLYVTDAAANPFAIEWLRFEAGSPMPKEIQEFTHVAYKVDDIQAELAGQQILIPPFEPMPGLKVAFILHEGVPVEFMQVG